MWNGHTHQQQDWNEGEVSPRRGMEYFPKDDNYLLRHRDGFPRMCVYDEMANGWQRQTVHWGEFTLPFGNYNVKITVPADHIIVGATGVLQTNAVLTTTEQERWKQTNASFDKPVIIVNQSEATAKEKSKIKRKKRGNTKLITCAILHFNNVHLGLFGMHKPLKLAIAP